MEKRDLYDKNKEITNEWIYKNDHIPNNRFILVVTLFLLKDDEVLIEKRSKDKGGKYAFITGHPKKGESSIEGIISETSEEIGLKIDRPKLIKTIKGNNTFFDYYVYVCNNDKLSLKLQIEEVDEVKWVKINEIEDMIKNNIFFEKHIDVLPILKEYLNSSF